MINKFCNVKVGNSTIGLYNIHICDVELLAPKVIAKTQIYVLIHRFVSILQ